jgi:hypothetical protein
VLVVNGSDDGFGGLLSGDEVNVDVYLGFANVIPTQRGNPEPNSIK